MMKILRTSKDGFQKDFESILTRAKIETKNVTNIVNELLDDIVFNKEKAIFKQIAKFDSWSPESIDDLKISLKDCKKAYETLDKKLRESLECAYERIYSFHSKQKPKTWLSFEENGNILGQKITPMKRAGLYIPGGKAFYPSSLLMNAIPAIVAGVEEIVVCTPAIENKPSEILLASLYLCGIKEAYKVGGASAIGLMAYGIDGIQKVDVITGPGNIFVATAKKLVFGEVMIDMIAGPSEIAIIADENANSKYIACDLLSQAEHDEMATSILITTDENKALESLNILEDLLPKLPRYQIAKESIKNNGVIIVAKDIDECVELSNKIAPEHLELLVQNPFELLGKIKNAGAIFLGENSPEPIGDYLAGPNHTLPTGGSARFFSPLNVEHFMKKSSIINFSKQGILDLGQNCAILAHSEHLDAHKEAVLARIKE